MRIPEGLFFQIVLVCRMLADASTTVPEAMRARRSRRLSVGRTF